MTIITKEELLAAVKQYYTEHAVGLDPVELSRMTVADRLNLFSRCIVGRDPRLELVHLAEAYQYAPVSAAELWSKGQVDLDAMFHKSPNLRQYFESILGKVRLLDVDTPLNKPVVAWLIDTLKPSTILWSTNDPIFDILQSVCKYGSRWVNGDEAREAAACLALLHTKATPPVKPEIGFFDAVARLKAVSGTDNILDFTDRLRADFGESFCLESDEIEYTVTPRVVLMRMSKSRGVQRVLWASTRAAVYRDMNAIGEVFDFTNEDNMQHLLKCYNAHTKQPLGETMPCSYFPSRNN